jgi:Zn-dependent alcohol dehydrogenase
MRAAILEQLNQPLVVGEIGISELRYGQVLVKVLMSGICGAQLQEIAGHKNNARFLPHLLGHEGCGRVLAVGAGVTRVKIGDKVVMHWRPGSGIDSEFPKYDYGGTNIGGGKVTSLSEQSIVSENRLSVVPEDIPDEFAALLGCSVSTAYSLIEKEAKLNIGERVLVLGAGGLGLSTIHAAKIRGASEVEVLEQNRSKQLLAFEIGASRYFEGHKEINKDFDVIVDTIADPKLFRIAQSKLASGGRYILVAQPKPGVTLEIENAQDLFLGEGRALIATQGGGFQPDKDLGRFVASGRSDNFKICKIITNRFRLDKINDAIEFMKKGSCGRIMIEMS